MSERRRKVLQLVYEGRYMADIGRELKITRQAVNYHIRKLEDDGLVVESPIETQAQRARLGGGTAIKVYVPTEDGIQALREATVRARAGGSPGGGPDVKTGALFRRPRKRPRVEVHNFEVKVPVRKGEIEWLPRAAELNNWTRKWDPHFHGVYLEVTTQHILLRAKAEGESLAKAEGACLRRLVRIIELLEDTYRLELGVPRLRCTYRAGRAKAGVVGSELAEGLAYQEGELGVVDSTPEPGTIHPKDPADVDRIVGIGRSVERTERMVEGMFKMAEWMIEQAPFLPARPETPGNRSNDTPGVEVH